MLVVIRSRLAILALALAAGGCAPFNYAVLYLNDPDQSRFRERAEACRIRLLCALEALSWMESEKARVSDCRQKTDPAVRDQRCGTDETPGLLAEERFGACYMYHRACEDTDKKITQD